MVESPEAPSETMLSTDPETGFATDGEWPVNHRLRAEAMARAGVTHDDAGEIEDWLIAETKDRLAAEDAEAESSTPSMAWKWDELAAYATSHGVEFASTATKQDILNAIHAPAAA